MPKKKIDYLFNYAVDSPDPRDYLAEEFLAHIIGDSQAQRPIKELVVQSQGDLPACTRFGIVHANNAQNILEYDENGQVYTQLQGVDVWNRSNKNLTLQAALKQMRDEGFIEGWVSIPMIPTDKARAIQQLKSALDSGNFVYTGSSNGDRGKIGVKPYTYVIREDGRYVGHARSICGYDDTTQMFKCINSRGPKRGDKGYFYLPYEYIDKIYTKYPLIDRSNAEEFKKFKRKQKAKEIVDLCHEFWNGEAELGTQSMLHSLADKLRSEYLY